ncbi:hypothetical protein AAFN88_11720 [Pelagibius sp. CAU 1746]|uniref:hypothetical protein n=1 Tax=Pelagibius sp. CAU 1746 TaxID=3140370 RepID=UPI00325AC531
MRDEATTPGEPTLRLQTTIHLQQYGRQDAVPYPWQNEMTMAGDAIDTSGAFAGFLSVDFIIFGAACLTAILLNLITILNLCRAMRNHKPQGNEGGAQGWGPDATQVVGLSLIAGVFIIVLALPGDHVPYEGLFAIAGTIVGALFGQLGLGAKEKTK